MKMFTLVCIIATSAIATAQTQNATTTTATAPTTIAKAKVKKAKKSKKAKQTEIETVATPVAQTTSATTTSEVAPAAGTSTAAPVAAAPKRAFGGYIISDTTADQSGLYGATGSNALQSVTTVGGSYQLTEATKVGIGQAFETASYGAYRSNLNTQIDDNNFRPMYVEPLINTTFLNFIGTDRTKLDFRVRLNNYNALWNKFGGAAAITNHYQLSTNSVKALTPQFAITMYNEARVYQYDDNSAAGTRISLLPGAGYAVNDALSFYTIAGYIVNTKDGESLTNKRERLYLETGLNYAPAVLNGLNINLLAFQDKMVSTQVAGEKVSSFSLYDVNNNNDGTASNDSLVYEAIINYNF